MYLILTLVFNLFLSICFAGFPGPEDYAVNGCRIFEPGELERAVLPGERCIFLKNGDFISSSQSVIRYFTSKSEIKWEVKGIFHHQLNISLDGKRLLAIGSVKAAMKGEGSKRFDQLLVLDLLGNVLQSIDYNVLLTQGNIKSISKINPYKNEIDTPFEGSHVNSFYEIPPTVKGVKVPNYIRPGNYIVNSLSQGLFIIDHELKKVLKKWKSPFSLGHNVHDAQITKAGTLIYFNNFSSRSRIGANFSTIDEYDFLNKKLLLEIKANPPVFFFSRNCGGVQILDEDLIMFSHVITGYYVYSRKKKEIIYSGVAPYISGNRVSAAQQIKIMDLTDFLKNKK